MVAKGWGRFRAAVGRLAIGVALIVGCQPQGEAPQSSGPITAAPEPGPETDGRFSILAFGARCDGSFDDTAGVEAAMQAARVSMGGFVAFPARTCTLSRPVSVPTAVTLVGYGRRSRVNAVRAMPAMFVFQIEAATGFFGGIRDLHIDGRSLVDYGVLLDSWLGARFSHVEGNNFRRAFVRIISDQHADSAGHVFDQVWVRDDLSTAPIGSRFAELSAGATGKVTDTIFRDCAVTAGTPFQSPTAFLWELSDTTRIRLENCRSSTTEIFGGSILITQQSKAPSGALVHDQNSGHNVVRDFYHEQQGSAAAVGVVIDGARRAAGQRQRGNVVENLNMQPSRATAVHVRNSGHARNAFDNRILLPQRTATYPQTVVIDPGAMGTRVWVVGGDDSITVGPGEEDTIRDRGVQTWVNGQLEIPPNRPKETPPSRGLGGNLGDVLHDSTDDRVYVVTRSGKTVQVGAETTRQRLVAWLTPATREASLGALPDHSWVVQPLAVDVVEAFSGNHELSLEVGTVGDPKRFGSASLTPGRTGSTSLHGDGEGGYIASHVEVVARISGAKRQSSPTGKVLVLLEYYVVGAPH